MLAPRAAPAHLLQLQGPTLLARRMLVGTLLFRDVTVFTFGHQRKPRRTNSITELSGVEQINFFFF